MRKILFALIAITGSIPLYAQTAIVPTSVQITEETLKLHEQRASTWLQEAQMLRTRGDESAAKKLLHQVVALPEPEPVGNQGPQNGGRGYLLRYRRSEAQQQLGEIAFARGDFALAFHMFQTRPPIWEQCGNGAASSQVRDTLWKGAALEGLHRTSEAVRLYAPVALDNGLADSFLVARRLEEIYFANGQTAPLVRFADLVDEAYWLRMEEIFNRPATPGKPQRKYERNEAAAPTYALRQSLQLSAMEQKQDWQNLLLFADTAIAARKNARAETAIRALTRHPQKVTTALTQFRRPLPVSWHFYTLGLCATPEAIAFLKKQLSGEETKNAAFARALVFALSLTEAGKELLAQIEPTASGHLLESLQAWHAGKLPDYQDAGLREYQAPPNFPPAQEVTTLPDTAELLALTQARRF